jgi:hypothetical protein
MSRFPGYAVITPARDEAGHLARLGACLAAQARPPDLWVIVDNGSTDDTGAVAAELTRTHTWVRTVVAPGAVGQARGGQVVRAFHAGLAHIDHRPSLIVKLDADVTFGDDYLACLLGRFGEEPELGIASGRCYELDGQVWRPRHITAPNVWGAARVYRRSCLDQLVPLEERMGWDAIDVVRANVAGWTTRVFPEISFRHHRTEAQRDGARHQHWVKQGGVAHYLGYRPSYLCLRAVHQARRDPSAFAMLWSFGKAALRREERHPDRAVLRHIREGQRLRVIPRRAVEALGRHTSH